MTIDKNERMALERALREKRLLLDGDPASMLLDVAESCLYQYNAQVAATLASLQQQILTLETALTSQLADTTKACSSIQNALATIERRITNMNPADNLEKRLNQLFDSDISSITHRAYREALSDARREFNKHLDRTFWLQGAAVLSVTLVVMSSVIFGVLLQMWKGW